MEFRMYGLKVELCRWKVEYEQDFGDKKEKMIMTFPTEEEADFYVTQYNGVKSQLPTDGYDWIDGYVVDEVPQPKNLAEEIIKKGFVYLQNEKQNENKKALDTYLENNPLVIDGKKYGVTERDQNEMMLKIIQYQTESQLSETPVTIEWHEKKKTSSEFNFNEFMNLFLKIKEYVQPYRDYQEKIKEKIYNTKTYEELKKIEIDYSTAKWVI